MPENKPINLLHTTSYTGYQFFAEARYDGQTPAACMKYMILTVMGWLREKIDADTLTQELDVPNAKDFAKVTDEQLKNVHFNAGFALDITHLPAKGIWSARIKEPETERMGKKAVIGRFFVTEIGMICREDCVELGVRIDVLDPVGLQLEPVTAYRPAFIKTLFMCRQLHFRQVEGLNFRQPHIVNNPMALKRLTNLIESPLNTLPVIVLTYAAEHHNILKILEKLDKKLKEAGKPGKLSDMLHEIDLVPETLEFTDTVLPYDASYMTEHTIGHARVYVVDGKMLDAFRMKTAEERLNDGDMLWIEPACFGGERRLIPYDSRLAPSAREQIRESIINEAHAYQRGKTMSFGSVVFETTARRMEVEERIRSRLSELQTGDERRQVETEREYDELLTLCDEEINELKRQNGQLMKEINSLYSKNLTLSARVDRQTSGGIIVNVPETDEFYPDEQRDLILSVLSAAMNSYCAEGSRAYKLLNGIVNENTLTGEGKKLFERLKAILYRNKNLTDSDLSDLRELGFEVDRFKNNHIKLVFKGIADYTFPLPSTASDSHSIKNCCSDIITALSVYK